MSERKTPRGTIVLACAVGAASIAVHFGQKYSAWVRDSSTNTLNTALVAGIVTGTITWLVIKPKQP